jgi:DNA polymerase-3 subunit epsilon
MPLSLESPLRTTEFLVVDTETNGQGGDACELTEIGAVLVGGGELHDRWETLVSVRAPLSRGIQHFTGITQDMVDEAPPGEVTLPELAELLEGRVMVAHNASFDRRVLEQSFRRARLSWPDPPVLCTVAMARRLAPLVRQRKLAALADSLGVPVETTHRALADAETCARILCALFGRLCAHAATIGDAVALLAPQRRRRTPARRTDGGTTLAGLRRRLPDLSALPDAPGVYVFRNDAGQPLYVGKSVSLRTRARSHFAPSSEDGDWTAQAETVDHVETASELGALLEEDRLIRALRPPGNLRGKHRDDRHVYLRCRLDIPFPILEVAHEPAAGMAVNIGPLRGRHVAVELLEQLNSLFQLRHCGRGLRTRQWPSAYGQMGRCLSPCLGDLDPNAYRGRLDAALGLFGGDGDGGAALLADVDRRMREASEARAYERAAWLRRRRERLVVLLDRLGGALAATHARPRLLLAPGLVRPGADAVWLTGGRVAEWLTMPEEDDPGELARVLGEITTRVLARMPADSSGRPQHLTLDEAAQARIATTWADANTPPSLPLNPAPAARELSRLLAAAVPVLPSGGRTRNAA